PPCGPLLLISRKLADTKRRTSSRFHDSLTLASQPLFDHVGSQCIDRAFLPKEVNSFIDWKELGGNACQAPDFASQLKAFEPRLVGIFITSLSKADDSSFIARIMS